MVQNMKIDKNSAALDTDFLVNISQIKREEESRIKIIDTFFKNLKIDAVMHPLVYKHEIPKDNITIAYLFEHDIVGCPEMKDILGDGEDGKIYYQKTIEELYVKLTGIHKLPVGNVFTEWKRKESLGEIHSTVMCLMCDCGIFLSDDKDSKKLQRIIEQAMLPPIKIYTRAQACDELKKNGTELTRVDLRALSHHA